MRLRRSASVSAQRPRPCQAPSALVVGPRQCPYQCVDQGGAWVCVGLRGSASVPAWVQAVGARVGPHQCPRQCGEAFSQSFIRKTEVLI